MFTVGRGCGQGGQQLPASVSGQVAVHSTELSVLLVSTETGGEGRGKEDREGRRGGHHEGERRDLELLNTIVSQAGTLSRVYSYCMGISMTTCFVMIYCAKLTMNN